MGMTPDRARALDEILAHLKMVYHKTEAQARAAKGTGDPDGAELLEEVANSLLAAIGSVLQTINPAAKRRRQSGRG